LETLCGQQASYIRQNAVALTAFPLVFKARRKAHLGEHFLGAFKKDGVIVLGVKQEMMRKGAKRPLGIPAGKRVEAVAYPGNRIDDIDRAECLPVACGFGKELSLHVVDNGRVGPGE